MYKLLLILMMMIGFSSCEKENFENSIGTVVDLTGTDGCGLVIQLDNTTILEPAGLPDNVQLVPNTRVEVKYRLVDRFSICMVGQSAEIIFLRYL